MSVYALFSITIDVDIEGFSQLLKLYKDVSESLSFHFIHVSETEIRLIEIRGD